jgi:hypothetical protein
MILLLTDETWVQLQAVLRSSPTGEELWRDLTGKPKLPSDRELIRLAREGAEPPPAIARVRDARNAGVEAAAQTREELARMVRHVHAAGVPGTALARWFGLNTSRIYEILSTTETPV